MFWKCKVSPNKVDDETLSIKGGVSFIHDDAVNNEQKSTSDQRTAVSTIVISKSDWSHLNIELQNSRDAALVASAASALTLSNLQYQFDLASKLAAVESTFRLTTERNKSTIANSIASESLDHMLEKQRVKYELAAVNAARVSDKRIAELVLELEVSERRFEDEIESRIAIERFTSQMTTEIAIQNMDEKLANQKTKYESAAFVANSKMQLVGAMLPVQLDADSKQARLEAEAEEAGHWIAKKTAKVEFDAIVEKMKDKFESAAAVASNASELSIETLKFKSQLASHFTKRQCDSRLISERAVSEVAVKVAEKANAVMLAEQQFKYEKAANSAREAFKASMDILQEDSQIIIDAFNVEMVAKDLKYVVAKLTAERLEQQILTDRLEQEAASATKESELLLSVCGNVAHDLKSPLFTLVLGVEGLRSSFPQSGEVLDSLESACAFMNAAISRTIDFTKASSSVGLNPCNTTFDLRLALTSPFKWMKAMLPQDGTITLQLDPLPAEIYAMIVSDQRWVEENLLCLLSNAVCT
jgi:signal transduction histidine kinase